MATSTQQQQQKICLTGLCLFVFNQRQYRLKVSLKTPVPSNMTSEVNFHHHRLNLLNFFFERDIAGKLHRETGCATGRLLLGLISPLWLVAGSTCGRDRQEESGRGSDQIRRQTAFFPPYWRSRWQLPSARGREMCPPDALTSVFYTHTHTHRLSHDNSRVLEVHTDRIMCPKAVDRIYLDSVASQHCSDIF